MTRNVHQTCRQSWLVADEPRSMFHHLHPHQPALESGGFSDAVLAHAPPRNQTISLDVHRAWHGPRNPVIERSHDVLPALSMLPTLPHRRMCKPPRPRPCPGIARVSRGTEAARNSTAPGTHETSTPGAGPDTAALTTDLGAGARDTDRRGPGEPFTRPSAIRVLRTSPSRLDISGWKRV